MLMLPAPPGNELAAPLTLSIIPPVLVGRALRRALLFATITHTFNEPTGYLVYLSAVEIAQRRAQLDADDEAEFVRQCALLIQQQTATQFVGYEGMGRFSFILAGNGTARQQLHNLAQQLVASEFSLGSRSIRVSPAIGYVGLSTVTSLDESLCTARQALARAEQYNDLQPVYYHSPRKAALAPGLALRSPNTPGWLGTLRKRLTIPLQISASIILGFIIPLLAYAALDRVGLDVSAAIYLGSVLILLVTSYLVWYESFQALRHHQPPLEPAAPYPPASAIIAAYLPNEAATIRETISAFLAIDYPGELEIVLAYNTPYRLPVEAELQQLAAGEPRLRLLRVEGSTSKAQNVNAAVAAISGTFVGIFDADHHPAPDSFSRAWRWLAHGYDVVQGHCVIRNGDDSWISRLVAVEFETIYAVAHPGRARMHGFGIFGGSNGYWKTDVLRRTRMRGGMLTEDIDSSLRALLAGYKIASDPLLISRELAPLTLQSLWHQRMRWAQGWIQVSLAHLWPALRSPLLSVRQKLGVFHLLFWREIYPWISIQIVTVLAFWIWSDGLARINLLIPIFVLTTILTFSSGPGQVLFAYLLGVPEIRRRGGWYLIYLCCTLLFYSGLKNLICRVALVKELMQEHEWKVTPRSSQSTLTHLGGDR